MAIPIYINQVAILNTTRQLSAVGLRKARSDRVLFSAQDVLEKSATELTIDVKCGIEKRHISG